MTDTGAELLAKGIVMQAAADYKKAYILDPHSYRTKKLEEWFHSKWAQTLLGNADADNIIFALQIQAKYDEWRKRKKCNTCNSKRYKRCIHRSGKHYTSMERGELHCLKEE